MTELLNIAHLFPENVTTYCCRINDYTDKLHPEEKNIISRSIDKEKRIQHRAKVYQKSVDSEGDP